MAYKGDIFYIEQVLGGNSNSFSYIVDHHKHKAFNLALKICGNYEEAEEVAQDAFMKVYRSLGSFQMKSSFSTWLYRIIYNTAISRVRIKKKSLLSLEDFPADATDFIGGNPTEEEGDREHRSAVVNYALSKITEEERGLITLYYYEELSHDEIADITGISKPNLKVKLFRARQKMLETIEKIEKKDTVFYG